MAAGDPAWRAAANRTMLCPHCGADTAAVAGRCSSCKASIVPASSGDAAATIAAFTAGSGAAPPRVATALQPGDPLGDRYRILRVLGAGGMGVVYQAWDDELGVAVALKVIRPEAMTDPASAHDVERRFKRELLLARQVTHKNVVRIHDISEVNGIKYLTMPFVDGRDLASILRESGTLPVPRALRFAKQIVAGLQAAHDAGVVHRDLKPENIMIDADDQALIMDFGISRSVTGTGAGTVMRAVVGTLEYMSPEQGRGIAADQRSDIYSFGLMLYDMLAGRQRQLTSESAVAELMSRMTQPPPTLRTRVPHVPAALEAIVAKCVDPDAERRYQTAAELAAALGALDGEGRAIAPVRPARWRLAATAASIVVLLALGVAGGWWWSSSRGGAPAPAPREPVSVLITDFDNQANETVFDGALEQALGIALEGASFVNIFPRRDAARVAAQIVKDARGIDVTTGRLVARREGVEVLVAGSISRADGGYRLEVVVEDPGGAREIARVSETVADKARVLPAVANLAEQLRRRLGDTAASLDASSETLTVGSLEAMHEYDEGQRALQEGRNEDALKAFSRAVQHDPRFGRAYSGMGVIYGNLGQIDNATKYYKRAMELLDHMTERERYRTLGAYYLHIARDYEKAIENFELLAGKYPADGAGMANLALAHLYAGNVDKAVENGRQAIEISPKNLLQRVNYSMYAMYGGKFDVAVSEARKILGENSKYAFAYIPLAPSLAMAGRMDETEAAYAAVEKLNPLGRSIAAIGRADLAMYRGNYSAALDILQPYVGPKPIEDPWDLHQKQIAAAESQLALGRTDQAGALARQALAAKHESVLYPAARVLLASRREADALRVAGTLRSMLQSQTTAYALLIEGEAALLAGRREEAVTAIREARKLHNSWIGRYLLARAFAGSPAHVAQASDELEWCLTRKGLATDLMFSNTPTLRYLPEIYYWLGRAHEGGNRRAAAREMFERYIQIRNASTSDPLLADARRRIDALTGT